MRLRDRVPVITGAASGMGRRPPCAFGRRRSVAWRLQHETAPCLSDAADQGYGERSRFVRADVAAEADVKNMIDSAVEYFGHLDIVFNNAGVGGAVGPLTETRVEDWDYTFDVLVKGVFLGIKHAVRVMRQQGRGGSIITPPPSPG